MKKTENFRSFPRIPRFDLPIITARNRGIQKPRNFNILTRILLKAREKSLKKIGKIPCFSAVFCKFRGFDLPIIPARNRGIQKLRNFSILTRILLNFPKSMRKTFFLISEKFRVFPQFSANTVVSTCPSSRLETAEFRNCGILTRILLTFIKSMRKTFKKIGKFRAFPQFRPAHHHGSKPRNSETAEF